MSGTSDTTTTTPDVPAVVWPPHLDVTHLGLRETLHRYGVAVVPAVLDDLELREARDGMWRALRDLASIDECDTTTYKRIKRLYPKHGQMLQHSIGHASYVWDLRQNPKIVQLFRDIYGTGDLVTSYDGVSILLPPSITGRGYHQGMKWHCDQDYTDSTLQTVQSWVTLYDVGVNDGRLAVLEGSHLYHSTYARDCPKDELDSWTYFAPGQNEKCNYFLERGCREYQPQCPAGSVVMWDSRTVHSWMGATRTNRKDTTGVTTTEVPPTTGIRSVAYICMGPRAACSPATLGLRIKAYEQRRMTGHHPWKVAIFPGSVQTYGKPNEIGQLSEQPRLTALGRRLVGYDH